jgi:hypothetical protein
MSFVDGCADVACREGAFTEEDALRLGKEAGKQLKAEAGPDFLSWSH